jgi:hypothetical protein
MVPIIKRLDVGSKQFIRTRTNLEAVKGSRRAEMELSVMMVQHPSCMHGMVHCASVLIFSSIYIRQHGYRICDDIGD